MNGGGTGGERGGLSRRGFLAGAGAAVLLAACSDDGGGTAASTTTGPAPSTTPHTARLSRDPFTLGVASGDPAPDSVILWTRLAPRPRAPDGLGGMPADLVDVRWQVATDEGFGSIVGEGVETADPAHAHAVHVEAGGLDAATDYFYRFTVGEFTSRPGRARTLPATDESVDRLSLAVVNCQWYETGTYAAYRHLQDEDVDLVLHLGDYIYEYPAGPGRRSAAPDHDVVTLADYRVRYAAYQQDPDLQGAHAAVPFVCMWDDHEVANNYLGDTVPPPPPVTPPDQVLARRAAAYQAWWESLPLRLPPPDGPDLVVYRSVAVGDLARIELLDERQYSDVAPCRDQVGDDFGDCAERTDDRTRLGDEQEGWFASSDGAGAGGVTWNLVGNPVVLAGVDGGTGGRSAFYLDTWDGYPDAQQRFIAALAEVDNPVVLTGDYHAGMVLDVRTTPFDQSSDLVATEFMAPPISSVLFDDDVSARTPQLRQQLNGHGYLTVVAEPDQLTATFRVLDDVLDPHSDIRSLSEWVVTPGDPSATSRDL